VCRTRVVVRARIYYKRRADFAQPPPPPRMLLTTANTVTAVTFYIIPHVCVCVCVYTYRYPRGYEDIIARVSDIVYNIATTRYNNNNICTHTRDIRVKRLLDEVVVKRWPTLLYYFIAVSVFIASVRWQRYYNNIFYTGEYLRCIIKVIL